MLDLNAMFANAKISYVNAARECEEKARDEEARAPRRKEYGRLPGGGDVVEAKAARWRDEAAYWGRMAAAAGQGLHLMETNRYGPATTLFPELEREALNQRRVLIQSSSDAPSSDSLAAGSV